MKKRLCVLLLLLAVMIMAWLPAMGEEEDVREINIGKFINVTRGETTAVEWPDFRQYFDWMSLSNFDITYTVSEGAKFTLNPDGSITVAEDAPLTYKGITFTFTPKVEGKGQKTIFNGISVYIHEKVTEIVCTPSEVVIYMDEEREVEFYTGKNTLKFSAITNISCNTSIIKTQNLTSYKDCTKKLNIVPQRYGTTDLVATAYNGVTGTMKVSVVRHPSYVRFGGTYFSCNEGETIDIGTDFGNGTVSLQQTMNMRKNGWLMEGQTYKNYITDYFDGDLAHFKAKAGMYDITQISVNGHEGTVRIDVFSNAACTDLEIENEDRMLLERTEENYIKLYDANGKEIIRPMEITKGSELAELNRDMLIAKASGEVEITVTNPDGSTFVKILEILPNPTQMTLNATELTLEVGDTFDFEIAFDKGTLPHSYDIKFDDSWPEYGLFPLKREGLRVTAQAPGTATFRAWTYRGEKLEAVCRITVLDNEKALTFDLPEALGIGETERIRVVDKTGKEYPATFALTRSSSNDAEITEDGYITGKESGYVDIIATLEDGRQMTTRVNICKKPSWLRHSALIIRRGGKGYLDLTSDLGDISSGAVIVTVEDESVVTYSNGAFTAQWLGQTEVHVKSIYNDDVQTSFSVEVVSADTPTYVGKGDVYLPYGFTMDLDALYNAVELDWRISYDNPGVGNTAASGFEIADDKLTCIWPTASCDVVGLSKDGSTKVKVTVYGFKLPDKVWFNHETIDLPQNKTVQLELCFDEPGAEIMNVYWIADKEGIVHIKEVTEGTSQTIYPMSVGTTLIMGFLDNGAYALCMVTVYDPYAKPDEPDVPSDRLPGDADQDGSVTIMDALAVLQYSVGWDVDISMSNADVDADGSATIMDALRILQYCVGWDAELL